MNVFLIFQFFSSDSTPSSPYTPSSSPVYTPSSPSYRPTSPTHEEEPEEGPEEPKVEEVLLGLKEELLTVNFSIGKINDVLTALSWDRNYDDKTEFHDPLDKVLVKFEKRKEKLEDLEHLNKILLSKARARAQKRKFDRI